MHIHHALYKLYYGKIYECVTITIDHLYTGNVIVIFTHERRKRKK